MQTRDISTRLRDGLIVGGIGGTVNALLGGVVGGSGAVVLNALGNHSNPIKSAIATSLGGVITGSTLGFFGGFFSEPEQEARPARMESVLTGEPIPVVSERNTPRKGSTPNRGELISIMAALLCSEFTFCILPFIEWGQGMLGQLVLEQSVDVTILADDFVGTVVTAPTILLLFLIGMLAQYLCCNNNATQDEEMQIIRP